MHLKLNENRTLSSVDPMIYGQFIEHFHRQIYGGVYDPQHPSADEDGFRTDVLEAMKKIRVPILRWPGGCFVSAYHWKYGVGPNRTPMFDKAWRVEEPNEFGTDEYIKLCRKIGCEPYICTNAGTGTAEEMSDWVEYCNLEGQSLYARWRAENSFPQPHHVAYWSIGNENWGGHEIGAKTAKEWGRLVTESAKMIRRTDPSVQLSAAALTDMDWNMEILKNCGDRLSWLSIHGYWDFHNGKNELADYETCMGYTEDLDAPVRQVKGLLCALGYEKSIRIAYDEWNLRAWYHPNIMDLYQGLSPEEYLYPRNDNDINAQYTMADAVFSACFLNMCIRNSDIVGMANFSPIVNTRGMIYTCPEGIVLRSTYHVFDAYVNYMENQQIDAWDIDGSCDTFWADGREIHTLDTAVTANEDGSRISAAIVNKHPQDAKEISLTLGSKPLQYRLIEVNGPSKDSFNDLNRTDVTLQVGSWQNADTSTLTLKLAPHSVNIIQIQMK